MAPFKQDTEFTPVLFRKWPKSHGGDVDAYFPLESDGNGLVSCYAHVGQHGSANLSSCIRRTKPAKPEEYAALKRELESAPYGYRLRVLQRSPSRAARREAERAMMESLRKGREG